MKFLLIGNHTCGNRGDAAILRGLIAELEAQYPQAELTVTTCVEQAIGQGPR